MSSGDKRPRGIKPVINIELNDDKKRLRIILLIGCLLIAFVALFFGLTSALNTDPGWKTVKAETSELNCGSDFVFHYYLGDSGVSATVENKQLSAIYSEATVKAFWLFHESLQKENLNNVAYLSAHPNETVTVETALYEAFSKIQKAQNRCLYLGAVYREYARIFSSESDAEAQRFDPAQNPEQAAYLKELAAFANDPEHIDLELLENNQVRLKISSDYLAYIQKNELSNLLDFGWMKNAFIVDYLAEKLLDGGFNKGYLVSYDGFTRNLDNRGDAYNFNLFDRDGDDVYLPALFQYEKPVSIVFLRNYPMSDVDKYGYYRFASGRIVTACVDPQDGVSKSALDNLVSYSYQVGCADILLQTTPVYLQDTFSAEELNELTDAGIYSIWFDDKVLYHNEKDVCLQMKNTEDRSYLKAFTGE